MPARERGTILDNIAGGPQDASLVELPRHVIVRAENIEVSSVQPLHHEVDGLLRSPGTCRFLGATWRGQVCEYEAGNQQVRADLAVWRIAKFVLQGLSESLHASLGDIVGRIRQAGW